jgi:hypothetical protein
MVEPNPDPEHITDPMWRLWTERPNSAWRLGGIWNGGKKGYHNSVNNNYKTYPGNYSIRFPLDQGPKNRNKARAIDLTMSTSEMIKLTTRMKNSALDPRDTRLNHVREFYGTLDGKTVYGLIKDDYDGPWRKATADETHLWHLHEGIFAEFVNDWDELSGSLSVWKGESFDQWKAQKMLPKQGDRGEDVKYWQYIHNRVRTTVTPHAPLIKSTDGIYGEETAKAFAAFWKGSGGKSEKPFMGQLVTGWLAQKYHEALIRVNTVVPAHSHLVPPHTHEESAIDPDLIRAAVDLWLQNNLPNLLTIDGTFRGKVNLDDDNT